MELTQWWLGVAVATLLVAAAALAWWRGRSVGPQTSDSALWVAHVDRLRQLPRYRQLVARQRRWRLVELISVGVAVLGVVALVSRPIMVTNDDREMRSRDIILCLDVSGSMRELNADVVRSYLNLVGELKGERIGFVVFDSAAATVFPLTDDYEFITAQLRQNLDAFTTGTRTPVLEAAMIGTRGSSLIGDGLASCVQQFDHQRVERSRTIVVATDNDVSGKPLFDLPRATDLAVEQRIMVFGIAPTSIKAVHRQEFSAQARRAQGELLVLAPSDPHSTLAIVRAVERSQRRAIMALPTSRSFDVVWPGAALLALGLAGMVVANRAVNR